jgi:hypothetical protein
MNFVKNPLGTFVAGILLVLVLGAYSASNVPAIGGTTNFDDLSVDSITVSGTATIGTVSGTSVSGTTVTGTTVAATTLTASGATNVELFTSGGGVLSTSTVSTAMVPTAATFNYGLIEVTPLVADLTYTFPASSTLSAIVPNAGDVRTVAVYNATSTDGIDVIFAAGAGMEIKGVGGGDLTIDEASFGTLTFVRKSNSDILVIVSAPTAD